MSETARFWDSTAGDWIDVSDRIKKPKVKFKFDFAELHVVEYNGDTFPLYLEEGETLNIIVGSYFEYLIDSVPVFSGYVKRIKETIKDRKYEIDIEPESEYLKTQSVPSLSTGSHYTRITEAMPAGYSIAADTVALSNLNETPNWNPNVTYSGLSFADFLFDTLLIMNGLGDFTFLNIIGKVLSFHSWQIDYDLDPDQLEEIIVDTNLEEIQSFDSAQINDNLRGSGAIVPPFSKPWAGTIYKTINKVRTIEIADIGQMIRYNTVDYGFLSGMSEKDGIYEYELSKLTFVSD